MGGGVRVGLGDARRRMGDFRGGMGIFHGILAASAMGRPIPPRLAASVAVISSAEAALRMVATRTDCSIVYLVDSVVGVTFCACADHEPGTQVRRRGGRWRPSSDLSRMAQRLSHS